MTELTYAEALKVEQHKALDAAVADGRISPEVRAIAGDLLDGKLTQEQADERYAALAPPTTDLP